jgi:hypothetical protein
MSFRHREILPRIAQDPLKQCGSRSRHAHYEYGLCIGIICSNCRHRTITDIVLAKSNQIEYRQFLLAQSGPYASVDLQYDF